MKHSIFVFTTVFAFLIVGILCQAATVTQVTSGTQSVKLTGDISLEKISDGSTSGGTYTLNQANDYTGTTTVTAGTLALTNANGASTGTINIATNAILNLTLNDGSATKNAIPNAVTGTGLIQTSSTGVFTLSNNLSGFQGRIQPQTGYLVFRTADAKQTTLQGNGREVCFVDMQSGTNADTTIGMITGGGTLRPSNQISSNDHNVWLAVGTTADDTNHKYSGVIRDQYDNTSGITYKMGIEKVGSDSVWTLSGENNTYTLGTKITAGVLEVTHTTTRAEDVSWTSNALGTGTVTLNGGTLRLSSGNMTIPNALNVAVESSIDTTVEKSPTLSGALTGSAKLNFTSSTGVRTSLFYDGDASAFTGTINIQGSTDEDGGFLTLGENATNLSGALVNLDTTSTARANLCVHNLAETKTFQIGMLTGNGLVRPNAQSLNNSVTTLQVGARTTDTNHTFSGTLSDYVSKDKATTCKLAVEKVGTGTWTLSNSVNAYSSGTKITEGTLEISAAALGTGTVTLNGGALKTITNDVSLTNAVSVTADSKIDVASGKTLSLNSLPTTTNSKTIELTGGTFSMSAADKATSTVGWKLNGGTLQVASGADLSIGNVNVASASTIDMNVSADEYFGGLTGSADLTISSTGKQRAVVHFTNDVSKYTGTLKMVVDTSTTQDTFLVLENGSKNMQAGAVDLAAGTNLFYNTNVNNQTFQVGMLTGSGNVKAYVKTPSDNVSTLQVGNDTTYTNHTFSGNLQNRTDGGTRILAVEKVGTNTWTLDTQNTFSGGMTVTGGTLEVNHVNALGTGTLTLNGGSVNVLLGGTISNPINVAADSNLTVNHANSLQLAGALSGSEDINYTSTARSVLWLNGNTSKYTGTINLASEREYFVVLNASAKDSSTVAFNIKNGGYIAMNADNGTSTLTNFAMGMLTGTGFVRHYANDAAGNIILTVGNDTEYENHTWSGNIYDHFKQNQYVALVKAGSNTWTIASDNEYQGSTKVTGGVLELTDSGKLSGTSRVTVCGGATLKNAGTIAGAVTVEKGGIYEATSSTASTGGLTISDGGILQFTIAEDQSVIPVDLTSASLGDFTTQILFAGENPEDLWEQSFKILQAKDESILNKLNISSLVPGTTFLSSFADGFVNVTAYDNNAIPEPATWLLLLLGGTALLTFRKKQ